MKHWRYTQKSLTQKIRQGFRALLLSGTMLTTAGLGYAEEPPAPTPAITQTNNTTARGIQVNTSASQVPEDVKDLWQNMQRLKNSDTLTGPALARFAEQAGIFYRYDGLAKGNDGAWHEDANTVKVARHSSTAYKTLVQLHETIHALQDEQKLTESDTSWLIGQFQMNILCYEAAAQTGEVIMALEFHLQGQDDLWNREKINYPNVCEKALEAYQAACAKGAAHADALTTAGSAAFFAVYENQKWLSDYNDTILSSYIRLLTEGHLQTPSFKTYELDTARKTGYISPTFNFLAKLDHLPAADHLFGNDKNMRHAFAYADLERLADNLGRDHSLYRQKLRKLEKEHNPYLGVDLRAVQATLNANPAAAPLTVMNTFAGLTDAGATPIPQKINMRPPKPASAYQNRWMGHL